MCNLLGINERGKEGKNLTRWVAFVSVSVGVGASQRITLSVLARSPHKGLVRKISHKTGRGRGKEAPRENKEGCRT